ncbi:MAG: hypothetical protein M1812_000601 [Candelaria pacifica]|nr:MAG: hypothetical protein M1812_000601 [Candelaria pacifica]
MASWAYNPPPPTHHLSSTQISPHTALTLLQIYIKTITQTPSLQPGAILTEQGPVPSAGASAEGIILRNLRRVEMGIRGVRLLDSEGVLDGGDGNMGEVGDGGLGDAGVDVGVGVSVRPREGDDARLDRLLKESQAKLAIEDGGDGEGQGEDGDGVGESGEGDGWQSLESYQREQRDVGGEIGERSHAVGEVGMVPRVREVDWSGKKKKRKRGEEGMQVAGRINGNLEEEQISTVDDVDRWGEKRHKKTAGSDDKDDRKQAKKLKRKLEKRERAETLAREKAAER